MESGQERGMRSFGLTHFGYKRQLQDWLDLSIQKNVPLSLLIMSRAFNLATTNNFSEDVLKSSISSLTDDTINEVILAAALPTEANSIEIQKRKLDSLQFQNEMINEEREESDEARQIKSSTKKKADNVALNENIIAIKNTNIDEALKLANPKAVVELVQRCDIVLW